MTDLNGRSVRRMTAGEYAGLYPARPRALRKIAAGLRKLGADDKPFTINQWVLAERCGVSKRTWQRYAPVFEEWGILEVKRWRYRQFGTSPNTYRVFLASVIPQDWQDKTGPFADNRTLNGRQRPGK